MRLWKLLARHAVNDKSGRLELDLPGGKTNLAEFT